MEHLLPVLLSLFVVLDILNLMLIRSLRRWIATLEESQNQKIVDLEESQKQQSGMTIIIHEPTDKKANKQRDAQDMDYNPLTKCWEVAA